MSLQRNRMDIDKWELWIEEPHQGKIEWAINYISKKSNVNLNQEQINKELFICLINDIPESAENKIILDKMMAAWRAKKHKEKTNRENCSFLLKEKTKREISSLAKKFSTSQSKTIEDAIYRYHRETKGINKEVQAIVKVRLIQKEKLINARKGKDKRDIEKLHSEIKLLKEKNAIIEAGYINIKAIAEEIILKYDFSPKKEEHEAIQNELWERLNGIIERIDNQ